MLQRQFNVSIQDDAIAIDMALRRCLETCNSEFSKHVHLLPLTFVEAMQGRGQAYTRNYVHKLTALSKLTAEDIQRIKYIVYIWPRQAAATNKWHVVVAHLKGIRTAGNYFVCSKVFAPHMSNTDAVNRQFEQISALFQCFWKHNAVMLDRGLKHWHKSHVICAPVPKTCMTDVLQLEEQFKLWCESSGTYGDKVDEEEQIEVDEYDEHGDTFMQGAAEVTRQGSNL